MTDKLKTRIENVAGLVIFVVFWGVVFAFFWYASKDTARAKDAQCEQACEFVESSGRRFGNRCVCKNGTTPLQGFGR